MFKPANLPTPIWIVAPHPDDEALGCGGLLAYLSDLGREVWAMLVTDGGLSHPNSASYPRPQLVQARLAEWQAGLTELGIPPERTRALGFPDGNLGASDSQAVQAAIRLAWENAPPRTLLLPWRRDPHPDHRACWLHFGPLLTSITCVLEYTVWLPQRGGEADWPRSDEGLQELLLPITAVHQMRKARAIAAHRTQLGLISDDSSGFTLSPEMVTRAVVEPERYFAAVSLSGSITL